MDGLIGMRIAIVYFLCLISVASAGGPVAVSVTETAGIRRGNYPVTVFIHSGVPLTDSNVSITGASSPASLQVDKAPREFGDSMYSVEFADTFMPNETRRYEIRHGVGVSRKPQPIRGHVLTETDDSYIITNKPYLTWKIPKNLEGLISSMNFPPSEHIRSGGKGIFLLDQTGKQIFIAGNAIESEVIRHGPLAVQLRFRQTLKKDLSVIVDLNFPVSRSWVEVQVRVHDPENQIAGIANSMMLNLDEPERKTPTIADFGGGTSGYVTLLADQTSRLTASKAKWSISKISSPNPVKIFASTESRAEGWAHIMDRERCLAMAVTDFGLATKDSIELTGAGHVLATRVFPDDAKTKIFRTWYHFVFYPPQVSAATGPQAMQNPLRISVRQ